MARLFLDASLVIRFLEGTPDEREALERRLAGTRTGTDLAVTTELLRFECMIKPKRNGNE